MNTLYITISCFRDGRGVLNTGIKLTSLTSLPFQLGEMWTERFLHPDWNANGNIIIYFCGD